jgi:DNA-binding IclR family transcriptional regulator
VPDGDLVHYIDQVDTPNPVVGPRLDRGARALHAVSSGQVLLAFRTPAAIERYLAQPALERFTPRTLAEPDAVRERLARFATGVSWAIEEFDADISSVARADRRFAPARSSPRSMSTGRRTGSRPREGRRRSRSWS